jgi:hypothetical protein
MTAKGLPLAAILVNWATAVASAAIEDVRSRKRLDITTATWVGQPR